MRDPMSWSLPLGRIFGITVKIHWFFPLFVLGVILRAAFKDDPRPAEGTWIDASMLMGLMFLAVLLHEFGHCFGARLVDGDAHEVLLWPLGGLAYVEVPHTARANFIAAAAGPVVNLLLCLGAGLLFLMVTDFNYRPTWNPLWVPYRVDDLGHVQLFTWQGAEVRVLSVGVILLARFFWINWVLFLLNMVLVGFPMDAGRMFQCILWPRYGFRQSMLTAIFAGFITSIVVFLVAIIVNQWLAAGLGLFIFVTCYQQRILLEHGGEDSVFGYDFSQGYTSLERGEPAAPPRRRRQSWWQRWQQRRAARRMHLETEQREAEERRMDELLEKVQHHGLAALSDDERRFLKRVSDKYRNRP